MTNRDKVIFQDNKKRFVAVQEVVQCNNISNISDNMRVTLREETGTLSRLSFI